MEETYYVKFIVMPKEKAKHEGNMLIVLEKKWLNKNKIIVIFFCTNKLGDLCILIKVYIDDKLYIKNLFVWLKNYYVLKTHFQNGSKYVFVASL